VWTSSDSTVAAVDEASGAVIGRAPGSARITATADVESAWIRLTVLPRPERIRVPSPDAEQQLAEAQVGAGVAECYEALRSRDVARLRELWHPVSKLDEDNLKRLSRLLRTREWAVVVGERLERAPTVDRGVATMEFSVPLAWKDPSAGARTSQPVFRAEFARTPDRLVLSSCRIVGSPRL
jgi:hypothetical protein